MDALYLNVNTTTVKVNAPQIEKKGTNRYIVLIPLVGITPKWLQEFDIYIVSIRESRCYKHSAQTEGDHFRFNSHFHYVDILCCNFESGITLVVSHKKMWTLDGRSKVVQLIDKIVNYGCSKRSHVACLNVLDVRSRNSHRHHRSLQGNVTKTKSYILSMSLVVLTLR